MSSPPSESFIEPDAVAPAPKSGVLLLMFQPRIVRGAFKVAAVVGTILNVINNGEQFWVHHVVNPWQVVMNFVVPYCVSSFSAARNEAQHGWSD